MASYNVFSDLEGFSIKEKIDKSQVTYYEYNNRICGDMIDSSWTIELEDVNL